MVWRRQPVRSVNTNTGEGVQFAGGAPTISTIGRKKAVQLKPEPDDNTAAVSHRTIKAYGHPTNAN